MKSAKARFRASLIVLTALAFAACADNDISSPEGGLQLRANSTTSPGLYLTKRGPLGTTATFSIVANGGTLPLGGTVTLDACPEDGSVVCVGVLVWAPNSASLVDVTVTETATTGGTVFDQIAASRTMDGVTTFYGVFAPDAPTITIQMNDNATANVRFKNVEGPPPPPPPPPPGLEGCTPGYWKQTQHFGNWVGYAPSNIYNTVFGVNLLSGTTTLLGALNMGGGGVARFARHSTAALLNAAGNVDYGLTAAQVIAAVQAAVASGNLDALASQFEADNERGCPLDRAE